jgi:hypothetical protein
VEAVQIEPCWLHDGYYNVYRRVTVYQRLDGWL